MGVASKQKSTFFSFIFWLIMTIGRFGAALYPGSPSITINYLTLLVICSTSISTMASLLSFYSFAVYFSSISLGMLLSPLFGLYFSLIS